MALTFSSQRIAKFREALGLSQDDLAGELKVSRVAVLRWEKGTADPKTETYVRLAKRAGKAATEKPSRASEFVSFARWFWEKAGVTEAAMRALSPQFEKSLRQHEKRNSETPTDVVRLPLLDDSFFKGDPDSVISGLNSLLIEGFPGIESGAIFPIRAIPRPRATIAMLAPDDCMAPRFGRGDIVAVDVSEIVGPKIADLLRSQEFFLYEPMVAAYYKPLEKEKADFREGLHFRSSRFSTTYSILYLSNELNDRQPRFARGWLEAEEQRKDPAGRRVIITADPESLKKELEGIAGYGWDVATAQPEWSILGKVVAYISSGVSFTPHEKELKKK